MRASSPPIAQNLLPPPQTGFATSRQARKPLALHRAMTENEMLRSANKRMEAALRTAGRVLEPYIRATNGGGR